MTMIHLSTCSRYLAPLFLITVTACGGDGQDQNASVSGGTDNMDMVNSTNEMGASNTMPGMGAPGAGSAGTQPGTKNGTMSGTGTGTGSGAQGTDDAGGSDAPSPGTATETPSGSQP